MSKFDGLFSLYTKGQKSSVLRDLLSKKIKGTISFGGGMPAPETFPADVLPDVLKSALEKYPWALNYGATEGMPELREFIGKYWLKRCGITNSCPERVQITTGSQQALDLTGKVLIDPKDTVIVEKPSYIGEIGVLRDYGARIICIKTENGIIDFGRLEKILETEKNIKFIYLVPTFQNPSGSVIPESGRKKILKLVKERGKIVIEDDPYSELYYGTRPPNSIRSLDREGDTVVYLGTFSKTFVPGARIGYLEGPEEIIRKVTVAKQNRDLFTGSLAQAMVLEYFENYFKEEEFERKRKIYREKRDIMLEALNTYMSDAVGVNKPEGGLFVWAVLNNKDIDTMKMLELAKRKLVEYVPGGAFLGDKNTMRLNFSQPGNADIPVGMERLAKTIEQYQKTAGS